MEGFLELSREDRCRLIGLRWRSSSSASEPDSEDVDEPSPSSELVEDDGPALFPDARVLRQSGHKRRAGILTLICLRLVTGTSPARGEGDLYVFTSWTTAGQLDLYAGSNVTGCGQRGGVLEWADMALRTVSRPDFSTHKIALSDPSPIIHRHE